MAFKPVHEVAQGLVSKALLGCMIVPYKQSKLNG
jgi:hypothetical protein